MMNIHRNSQHLHTLLEPVITTMGYELVGIEYHAGRGDGLLRVYIDNEAGISLDDCQQVSHQVSGLLDVEDPIPGNYTLEVSSPGLDRPLFNVEHYRRFSGHQVRLSLIHPLANGPKNSKRKLTGLLKGLHNNELVVEVDGTEYSIPLDAIDKARLVPEI